MPQEPEIVSRSLWFCTPIYEIDIEIDNAFLLRRIYHERDQDPVGMTRSNLPETGAWHSHVQTYVWIETKPLLAAIGTLMQTIAREHAYPPELQLRLVSMWANVLPKGGITKYHSHPLAHWAGIYYAHADDSHSHIRFHDPRPQALHGYGYLTGIDDVEPEVRSQVRFQPRTGRLLIFPAWLAHEVEPNLSETDRVSLSFNIVQDLPE